MPLFEIEPEDGVRNPYRAVVTSPNDFGDGDILVQPPFVATPEYFHYLHTEQSVTVRHLLTSKTGTLLNFETTESETGTNEERVRLTVGVLIKDLGHAASKTLFESDTLTES
jgi:hypothetical protein